MPIATSEFEGQGGGPCTQSALATSNNSPIISFIAFPMPIATSEFEGQGSNNSPIISFIAFPMPIATSEFEGDGKMGIRALSPTQGSPPLHIGDDWECGAGRNIWCTSLAMA
ncbi:hypothetical protein NL676_015012 [Syzygium grande]|nr:hypothetical protein NL676_015012 [Syzygium grande]